MSGLQSVVDALLGSTGQDRRAWLDRQDARLTEGLGYYLGPAAAPLGALAQGAAMVTDGADFLDAYQSSGDLMRAGSPMEALGAAGGLGAASLGMFLGPAARIANKGALEVAEGLARQGADARRIWDETGWFQGADGKWRFEIDDSGAGMRLATSELSMKKRGTLGRSLNHDELYQAYPDLADAGLRPGYGMERALGNYNPETDSIALNAATGMRDRAQMRDTTLHEVQHAIQQREGFSRGGNLGVGYEIKDAADRDIALVNRDLSDLAREMDTARAEGRDSLGLRRRYEELMGYKERELIPKAIADPYDHYRAIAGEVEARNVQTRRDYTPEQRRATPPWETEDVPRDQQIVRFGGGVQASEPTRAPLTDVMSGGFLTPPRADMPLTNTLGGIRAYHGSPHDFDRFSLDKIGAGDGSRNYVVFDDSMIDILRKYGLLPLMFGGGLAAGGSTDTPAAPGL